MSAAVKAPFQYFGGKVRVAADVWARLGDVRCYIEPFFGSGAVLLARPTEPQYEIVNDLDCYLANFWRAVQADPGGVARYADWPVNEVDLHARQTWILGQAEFRERMNADPDYFDAKLAGWWVWGQSASIGNNWLQSKGANAMPCVMRGYGINSKGRTLHIGRGVGVHQSAPVLEDKLSALQKRLRRVKVCCGDWKRIMGIDPAYWGGQTGVFLDPPYGKDADRHAGIYSNDDLQVAEAVRTWALDHGENPLLRIALCGYDGEHEMPKSWETLAWKGASGYSALGLGKGKENRHRERIWFSPACLRPDRAKQASLFDLEDATA